MALRPNDVRVYIEDFPEVNELLGTEENSDERICLAMRMAVNEFNTMTPFTSFEDDKFPYFVIHMYGTIKHLLLGLGVRKTRNRLAFTTGGTSVDEESAAPQYLAIAQQFDALFREEASNVKKHLNVESGYGSVPSEYSYIGFYYNRTNRNFKS